MQALQIESETDQGPFIVHDIQAAQQELAKAEHRLDDANNRFDSGFAQAINGLADGRLQLVGHLDRGRGIRLRRERFGSESFLPALVMGITPGGNVGFDAQRFTSGDVTGAEVAVTMATAVGVPSADGKAARVGLASALSLGWFDNAWATINRVSWSTAIWAL